MAVRAALSIVALVLTLLGIVFVVVGLLAGEPDGGAMTTIGLVVGGAGLVLAIAAVAAWRRARAALRRRQEGGRGTATIVSARFHPHTRIGALLTWTLTLRYESGEHAGREVTRQMLLVPTIAVEEGARVEVAYDRADAANVEVLRVVASATVAP